MKQAPDIILFPPSQTGWDAPDQGGSHGCDPWKWGVAEPGQHLTLPWPYFRANSSILKIPSLCKPQSFPRTSVGKRSHAPCGTKHFKHVSQKKMSNHGWPNRQMGEGEEKLTIPARLL